MELTRVSSSNPVFINLYVNKLVPRKQSQPHSRLEKGKVRQNSFYAFSLEKKTTKTLGNRLQQKKNDLWRKSLTLNNILLRRNPCYVGWSREFLKPFYNHTQLTHVSCLRKFFSSKCFGERRHNFFARCHSPPGSRSDHEQTSNKSKSNI